MTGFNESMIAPCGINCATCLANIRDKNRCLGCRIDFPGKRKTCNECRIKNCQELQEISSGFCYDCQIFPCDRIKHIDKRYRLKYRSGLIENLISIRHNGIGMFLKLEAEKWACPNCGAITSIHRYDCPECNKSLRI